MCAGDETTTQEVLYSFQHTEDAQQHVGVFYLAVSLF